MQHHRAEAQTVMQAVPPEPGKVPTPGVVLAVRQTDWERRRVQRQTQAVLPRAEQTPVLPAWLPERARV